MNGYPTKYLHYKSGKSVITIPRAVLEANKLNWQHKDKINLEVTTIEGIRGIFLYKKEEANKDK